MPIQFKTLEEVPGPYAMVTFYDNTHLLMGNVAEFADRNNGAPRLEGIAITSTFGADPGQDTVVVVRFIKLYSRCDSIKAQEWLDRIATATRNSDKPKEQAV